jgi:ABC-type multidrug transport system ATPase subunit
MIEVSGVSHHYGVRPVLNDVDLTIAAGELVVIVGPNGMGKTTLLGIMGGVISPYRGTVTIDGLVRRRSAEEETEIRRKAVYLPDKCWLPAQLTGREFLLGVGRLYDIEAERLMDHVERLLGLFELGEQADSPIRGYSSGQQKKVALCSALVTEAPVMFLDEPFSGGLDPAGILALRRVLRQKVKGRRATIILTSPVPELVEEVADRVLLLRQGEVLAFDTPDGLRRSTGCHGSLAQVLERLIYPEMRQHLDEYLQDYAT